MDEHFTIYSWDSSSDRRAIDRLGIEVFNPTEEQIAAEINKWELLPDDAY